MKQLTTAEFFGDFWDDIFSLKITTRKDEEERMKYQQNLKSHHLIHGGIVNQKSMSKRLEESGYLKKVMLFNATPKVNLSG